MITESQIYTAVIGALNAGFKARVPFPVVVKQWYQGRVIGAIPAGQIGVLLSNVSNPRYGFLGRQDVWDMTKLQETHTETQATQKTIQVTGQFKPAPPPATNAIQGYSASDITAMAATILASDTGRGLLRIAGFGIERITEIRQPYFKDESDQFEQVPSFDFTLDFNQLEVTQSPIVDEFELDIYEV